MTDDYESLVTIRSNVISGDRGFEESQIDLRIIQLLERGFIEKIGIESVDANQIWYGLTASGYQAWEKFSQNYSDKPVDWTGSWIGNLDHEASTGYVAGINREICEIALTKISADLNIEINQEHLRHSSIDGFWAKYYKWISDGHRIDFTFQIIGA